MIGQLFLVALERAFLSVEAVEVRGVSSCFCNSNKFQFTKQIPCDKNTRHLTGWLEIRCLGMFFFQIFLYQNKILLCLKLILSMIINCPERLSCKNFRFFLFKWPVLIFLHSKL